MPVIEIRLAEERDVAGMASIRASEWQTAEFWTASIGNYLRGTHFPQQAQARRCAWVAVEDNVVVGFVAGHLTTRFHALAPGTDSPKPLGARTDVDRTASN